MGKTLLLLIITAACGNPNSTQTITTTQACPKPDVIADPATDLDDVAVLIAANQSRPLDIQECQDAN